MAIKTQYANKVHAYPNPSFQLCSTAGALSVGYPVVRDITLENHVKLAGANARIIGISMEAVSSSGEPVAVKMRPCYAQVKISDTIVDGDTLKTSNDGTFVKASTATTDIVSAIAQVGGATGEYIEVLLVPPYVL